MEALRDFDHDVLTIQEANNAGQGISDEEVLAFAIQQNWVVVTINRRDFMQLHKSQPEYTGIIACTQDADTHGQAKRIHQAIMQVEDLHNQLLIDIPLSGSSFCNANQLFC